VAVGGKDAAGGEGSGLDIEKTALGVNAELLVKATLGTSFASSVAAFTVSGIALATKPSERQVTRMIQRRSAIVGPHRGCSLVHTSSFPPPRKCRASGAASRAPTNATLPSCNGMPSEKKQSVNHTCLDSHPLE
jgi:hypothetical protein